MSAADYDCIVVGGGPAGATAATDLARAGRRVLLLDRAGRIKPCGGAIPPRLIADFAIPDDLLVARITAARMIAPSGRAVEMPVGEGFVGMVDRDTFDEWLRERAVHAGADRRTGTFERIERDPDGCAVAVYRDARGGAEHRVRARSIVGADGARSKVARDALPASAAVPCVFAYHEVVRAPADDGAFDAARCDVIYDGAFSPDFYGWVFPHGATASIGVGSAAKGFALREATARMRAQAGLAGCETIRREGAPIPLRPRKRWDDGRDTIVAGDAAGVVAPASGEGIYYAMTAARHVAAAVDAFLTSGNPRALRAARRNFMRAHRTVFWILGAMQYFWYASDRRRERFVAMCDDRGVQELTWQAYMQKRLVRTRPLTHARIFFKDVRHLLQSAA